MESNFESIRFIIEQDDGSYGGEISPSKKQEESAVTEIVYNDYFKDNFKKIPSELKVKMKESLQAFISDVFYDIRETFYDDLKEYFEDCVKQGVGF